MNRNVVATIFFKYIRHSLNRIQSKNHGIRKFEITKFWMSCFNDKIYIQNNGYDGLPLGYQVSLEKKQLP